MYPPFLTCQPHLHPIVVIEFRGKGELFCWMSYSRVLHLLILYLTEICASIHHHSEITRICAAEQFIALSWCCQRSRCTCNRSYSPGRHLRRHLQVEMHRRADHVMLHIDVNPWNQSNCYHSPFLLISKWEDNNGDWRDITPYFKIKTTYWLTVMYSKTTSYCFIKGQERYE